MLDIKLEHVSVAYSNQESILKVLDDVTLAIRQGEWVSVVGRNGSGKSTLARVLAGLLPVSAGIVELGWTAGSPWGSGTSVPEAWGEQTAGSRDVRILIRMVMQNPESQLIGESVEEDLLFTLELAGVPYREREQQLQRVLEAVGLQDLRYHPTAELSGGQKQLLAVAGCIAAEAELIIFDEATSMLDPFAREKLLQTARELYRQGVTIIWVTHAMEELAAADRVVVLEEGRLAYEGDVRRFFYEDESGHKLGATACERFGFEPPFAVQAARELIVRGVPLIGRPLTWEALQQELEVRHQ